ncbi:MAG: hypothetical protein H0U27_04410, partial [Nitrosopumilus sp.]|nr:hypothetical protein [Nitrosopumilus sp.]
MNSSVLMLIFPFLKRKFQALSVNFKQFTPVLKKVNPAQSELILANTQFQKEVLPVITLNQNKTIDQTILKENDLQPVYCIKIYDTEVFFSKPFFIDKYKPSSNGEIRAHYWVVAYIKGPEDQFFQPRVFYRSRSQNIWRTTPAVKPVLGGVYLHKGYKDKDLQAIESSINLPWLEICLPLNRLINESELANIKLDATDMIDDDQPLEEEQAKHIKASKIAYGLAPKTKTPNTAFAPFQEQIKEVVSPFIFEEPKSKNDKLKTIYDKPINDIKNIKLKKDRGMQLDYSLYQQFDLPGSQSLNGTAYIIPSLDLNWRYVFYVNQAEYNDKGISWSEVKTHPSLATVEYVGKGQGLTNFGSYKIIADSLGADMPAIEYDDQLPTKFLKEYIDNNKEDSSKREIASFENTQVLLPKSVELAPQMRYWPTWR